MNEHLPAVVEDGKRPVILSSHPWAILPQLVEAGILTEEQARDDIVLAHQHGFRRFFRELEALLPELLELELIDKRAVDKIRRILANAQAGSTPDGHS